MNDHNKPSSRAKRALRETLNYNKWISNQKDVDSALASKENAVREAKVYHAMEGVHGPWRKGLADNDGILPFGKKARARKKIQKDYMRDMNYINANLSSLDRLNLLNAKLDDNIELARIKLRNGLIAETQTDDNGLVSSKAGYKIYDPKSGTNAMIHVPGFSKRRRRKSRKRHIDIGSNKLSTGSLTSKRELADNGGGIRILNTLKKHAMHTQARGRPKKFTTGAVVNTKLGEAILRASKDKRVNQTVTNGLKRAIKVGGVLSSKIRDKQLGYHEKGKIRIYGQMPSHGPSMNVHHYKLRPLLPPKLR